MSVRIFKVEMDGEKKGDLEVKITDEGLIIDLWIEGEVVATWGHTADELVEMITKQ